MNENKPIEEKKKIALLRYLAVLFAVAFVLVLLSLLGQMRSTSAAMDQINALQRAEALQEQNRQLQEEVSKTKAAYEDLLTAMTADPEDLPDALEDLQDQTSYLDQTGLDIYESLKEKVEK